MRIFDAVENVKQVLCVNDLRDEQETINSFLSEIVDMIYSDENNDYEKLEFIFNKIEEDMINV